MANISRREIFADYFPQIKTSAHNKLLLTCVIAPMADELGIELRMRGYHVYSEATAGEELLCKRELRNTKDSNCYA